jgi:hypothetical protein
VFILLSFLSTIPVSISLTEGTGFYCGGTEPIVIDKTTGILCGNYGYQGAFVE